MCELAFNISGEPFDPPAEADRWQVFKMKARGAPEVAYNEDGLPAYVAIDATRETLRNAVSEPGRYRLNPADEHGRRIEGAQAAYVIVPAKPQATVSVAAEALSDRDVLAKALQHNTELARAVIDRFPEMMHAAAELLRAADGAGLPARIAPVLPLTPAAPASNVDDEDDGDEKHPVLAMLGIDLNQVLTDVGDKAVARFAGGMPSLADMTDWGGTREAKPMATTAPKHANSTPATTTPRAATPPMHATVSTSTAKPVTAPQLDPSQMRQMLAIYTSLSPDETKLVRQLAQELSTEDRQAWIAELSALPVAEALAKVRGLLTTDAQKAAQPEAVS
ncbi:MAG: hypothetical protein QM831_44000 [Kofleriaceae bacterium]